jgi:hypothetical protein
MTKGPAVTGTFEDKEHVELALASLARHDVPEEAIDLVVIDPEGLHSRQVSASAPTGWLRGLLVGGIGGAVFGAAVLFGIPIVPSGVAGVLPASAASTLLLGLLAGGIAGATIGAFIAVARGGRAPVSGDEAARSVLVVSVRGESVADTARAVLAEAGATRISG